MLNVVVAHGVLAQRAIAGKVMGIALAAVWRVCCRSRECWKLRRRMMLLRLWSLRVDVKDDCSMGDACDCEDGGCCHWEY